MNSDTIAAIASGLTKSGIGIIRISGGNAIILADKLMHLKGALAAAPSHSARFGYVYENGERLDEAIVLIMRGPKSYTGEDVAEIQCHGGPYLMKRVLGAVLSAGARLAQPGEFTKRAFLNGRLDLSQAEAVMDLIASDSEAARRNALAALGGSLRSCVDELRKDILHDAAYLEAAMDDPEHISADEYKEELLSRTKSEISRIDRLLDLADRGRVIREGLRTAIIGSPNAGKSTLMNMLLGQERSIVTDKPGTTRDTIEESIQFKGISLVLTDTAGLREAEDTAERIGVERARAAAEAASLVLYICDGTRVLNDEEENEIRGLRSGSIVVINKEDAGLRLSEKDIKKLTSSPAVVISAKNGSGREELERTIVRLFDLDMLDDAEGQMIANERQRLALMKAREALLLAENGIESGIPEDLYTGDMMDAYKALGRILGKEISDDLADEIFAGFCMGK